MRCCGRPLLLLSLSSAATLSTSAAAAAAGNESCVALARTSAIVEQHGPLAFPANTPDPFLFMVYHKDDYPQGDGQLRPLGGSKGNGADFDPSAECR